MDREQYNLCFISLMANVKKRLGDLSDMYSEAGDFEVIRDFLIAGHEPSLNDIDPSPIRILKELQDRLTAFQDTGQLPRDKHGLLSVIRVIQRAEIAIGRVNGILQGKLASAGYHITNMLGDYDVTGENTLMVEYNEAQMSGRYALHDLARAREAVTKLRELGLYDERSRNGE